MQIHLSSLFIAEINLKKFKNRVKLIRRSIEDIRNIKFDLIVSNPPYVRKREINRLSGDIKKFEPKIIPKELKYHQSLLQ